MKRWIKIAVLSFLLFAILPLSVDAAENKNNLTLEKNQVAVSLSIPEGKTGAITSLRLQLRVTAESGTMGEPSFAFESSIKSEVQDAAVTKEANGSYLVDLILSGKKDKDIFGNSEYVRLGLLSPKPTSAKYEIKVEIVGEMDDNDQPVVRYVDAGGTTAMTAPIQDVKPVVLTSDTSAAIPKPVLAASVKDGSKSVSFSWKKLSGIDGYVLYEINGKKYSQVKALSASAVNASKNYAYASTHTFSLRAYKTNKDGSKQYGDYSAPVTVTVGPDKVKSFSPQYKSTSKVTLSWKKASGASGYEIYRSTKKSGKYKLLTTVKKGSATSCTVKHENKKTYYYKIRAYITKSGKTVRGNFCGAAIAKTKAPNVKASVKSKKVTLKWGKVSRASGYKVYRSNKKSGKYKLVKTIQKASKAKYSEKLPKGSKTWYYKVCAYETPKKGKTLSGNYSSVVKAKVK